jgi:hypothetical protein
MPRNGEGIANRSMEGGIHRVLRSLVGGSLNKLGRRRVREGADGGEEATEKMNRESNQQLDGNRSRHRVNTVTMPAIMMERSLNDCVASIQSNTMLAKYTFCTGEKVWKYFSRHTSRHQFGW